MYNFSALVQTWAAWLGIYNVEISEFFCHSDLTWNQLWSFWSPQKLPFWPYEQLWILNFRMLLTISSVKFQKKNQNSNSPKWLKWQFWTFWNQPKLISCNIGVAGKLLNFHTVEYPQSKFPIRLPISVMFVDGVRFWMQTFWKKIQR